MHVPLIVRFPPAVPAGRTYPQLIEHVDLAPTVVDFCGIQMPPVFQGRSLRPLLEGRPFAQRDSVFIEHRLPFDVSWKSIRTRSFKYCCSNSGEERLYDLERDPRELINREGEEAYRDDLAALRHELLRRWFDVEKQYPRKSEKY